MLKVQYRNDIKQSLLEFAKQNVKAKATEIGFRRLIRDHLPTRLHAQCQGIKNMPTTEIRWKPYNNRSTLRKGSGGKKASGQ